MGHSKLNLAMLIAGAFTLGAAVGIGPTAEASPLVLNEVIVQGGSYVHACTEWRAWDDQGAIVCLDCDEVYDADHYAVETDTDDASNTYLVVWK